MNLNLFTCTRGGYLMTPECMLASTEARALHGAVEQFMGVVDSALLPDEVRRRIEAEVDRHAFAYLSQDTGSQLLAIRRTTRANAAG